MLAASSRANKRKEFEMTPIAQQPGTSTQRVAPVRTSFQVSVTVAQGTPGAQTLEATIAAWVFRPQKAQGDSLLALWYLGIPGATYRGLSYFDRQVDGADSEEFSLARFLAREGIGLVVIDTLGTGESEVAVSGELITRQVTAEANAQILEQMRTRLLAGTLVAGLDAVPEEALFLGGIGHSMGAFQLTHLTALLEERGTPLDATVFAGWSHLAFDFARIQMDVDAIFSEVVVDNGYMIIPRRLMRAVFYGPQPSVPAALIEADERDAIPFPKGLLDEGMVPGVVAADAGKIRCPVLYVAAAHDFSPNAQAEGGVFRSTRLFTAYTQPAAAHCNFEASRKEYWRVVAGWSRRAASLMSQAARVPGSS
jgi:pimeloyl-ACP methyl ester carboxylesterase